VSYGIFHKRRRKIMTLVHSKARAGIAALTFAGAMLASAAASATTITFSGLAGANGTPVATYTEGGFTATNTIGQFFEGQEFGNPVPSLFAGPVEGGPVNNALAVTNGGGLFFFDSVDLAANNGDVNFTFTGFLGGVQQYAVSGVELGRFGPFGFDPIINPNATIAIDDLRIALNILGTSGNVDNIALNPIPGPIAGAGLPGLILATGVLLALARRRRQRTA
jgi:hypothetical protein